MDAVILAGGEGTRLRPLTLRTPKQLVPILGQPLLGHLVGQLAGFGVDRVVLAMTRNAASAAVVEAVRRDPTLRGSVPPGLAFVWAFEDRPLGSGGAVANAVAVLGAHEGTLLVCNGDLLSDIDLDAMRAAHRASGALVSIALAEVDDPSAFGVVALGADDRIERFVEKPPRGTAPSNLVNAGYWLFEADALARLSTDRPSRVEDELFPQLADAGEAIFGYRHAGYWRDIGNPAAYLEAQLELLDRRGDSVVSGPNTTVAASATIERSCLGADCEIGDSASVNESVLWDGVRIGAGASVRRSVLAQGVTVGAGAQLDGVVVGHGATVAPGAVLDPGTSVDPAPASEA